jgi:hypothetical protein
MPACYRTVLLTSLVASVLAVPALAQTSPALTNFPACTVKPTASDSDAAHSAFLLGKRFFDEADYGSAIHNFVDAYKLDCTKTELLTIIARANELSGDRAEAVHALETYLQRVQNLAPEDRAQIQKRIDNLKSQLPAQTSSTAPPQAIPVPSAAPPPAATTEAPPAPPSPPETRGHGAGPWVVTGIGGAAVVAGGIIWIIGHGKYDSALSTCPTTDCPPTVSKSASAAAVNEGNTGHTLMWVGGPVFLGGIGLAGAGLLWHFLEPTGSQSDTKATIAPELGPGYAGASVAGRF